MSTVNNPLFQLALAPVTSQTSTTTSKGSSSFFEAMSRAWGDALDKQANLITEKSDAISGGDDTPGAITELTAQSMKMGFLSNSAHTSQSAVSDGINSLSRKQ
jgi:hypothetical protein